MKVAHRARVALLSAAVLVLGPSPSIVWSYDGNTHTDISRESYTLAKVDAILADQFGLSGKEKLPRGAFLFQARKTPLQWLQQGSKDEDEGARVLNHFYDPIYHRGLTVGVRLGERSYEWGLEAPQELSGQEYSYKDARRYYLLSLTEADPDARKRGAADTFYTLGHVIHLIQDMASPAHTRNASHTGIIGPRSVVERYLDSFDIRPGLKFGGYGIPREGFTQPRDFWVQTDAGGTPQNGPSARGLSQIMNRNFVSEGTNFTSFVDGNHAEAYANPTVTTGACHEETVNTQDADGRAITGLVTFCGNSFIDPNTGVLETNPRMTTFFLFSR